jgi:hypothetical protein
MPEIARRKFGSIRERRDGNRTVSRYEARYKIGRKNKTIYAQTEAKANQLLKKVEKHLMQIATQYKSEIKGAITNIKLFRLCGCERFCSYSKYMVPDGEKYNPSKISRQVAADKRDEHMTKFLAGEVPGGPSEGEVSEYIRDLLIKRAGNKCEKCGYNGVKSTGRPNLEINHIDGNNYNHHVTNLEVLCPNCHRELKTFRWSDFTHKRHSKTPRNPNSHLVEIRKGHLKNKQTKEKKDYG